MANEDVGRQSNGAQRPRVLVVDDDHSMCEMLETDLGRRGYHVSWFTEPDRAIRALEEELDVAVIDLQIGTFSGLELAHRIRESRPELPVVMITAFGSMDSAIAAIRTGAYDFITKPIELEVLALAVARAAEHHRLRQELKRLRSQQAPQRGAYGEALGESRAMRDVFALLTRLSDSAAPVLINGETGTGKEVISKALHDTSAQKNGPFVAVNCAAVPANLLESILFGHVAGAFTDARTSSRGLFLEADGGTLFLDEIGEMALEMQSKLLRVLQERRVRPVGGSREIPFDARVISATNRDLQKDIQEGRFRRDLYYRLNVVSVDVPPLRDRDNDVLILAQLFLKELETRTDKRVTGLTSDAARKLLDYEWPGNVRELRNAIERAHALTRFDQITVEDLPDTIRQFSSDQIPVMMEDGDPEQMLSLHELEQRHIKRVLKATLGNKAHAARLLGVDRRTLYRKLGRYQSANHAA